MLLVKDKNRTYPVIICDTTFQIISMDVGEKEQLTEDLQHLTDGPKAFDRLLDIICPVIKSIDGFEGKSSREVITQMEDIRQVRDIIFALVSHCNLTKEEAKNLSSSSEQVTPESTGSVEQNAEPENAPVSITSTATVVSP